MSDDFISNFNRYYISSSNALPYRKIVANRKANGLQTQL